jgi:hypothetical protein
MYVRLDGALGDEELAADLGIGQAFADQRVDFCFTGR